MLRLPEPCPLIYMAQLYNFHEPKQILYDKLRTNSSTGKTT